MKLRSYQRPPQKNLFDAQPAAPAMPRWHDGASIDYLGARLRLQLDTDRRQAMRHNDVLHLPLPPDATPRQIQDAAESWLRREAEVLFSRMITNEIAGKSSAHKMPKLSLSFALRGRWVQAEGRTLRLNWRLI